MDQPLDDTLPRNSACQMELPIFLHPPLPGVCYMDPWARVYLYPGVDYMVPGTGHVGIHGKFTVYPGYILCDGRTFLI